MFVLCRVLLNTSSKQAILFCEDPMNDSGVHIYHVE